MSRRILLKFDSSGNDFGSLTRGATALGGEYDEVMTFRGINGQTREFRLAGYFSLNRISPIPSLTKP